MAHVPFHTGDWTITEIDPRPSADGGQWFEVRNNTATTQNLIEQVFSDSDGTTCTISIPMLVTAGGYAVLAAAGSPAPASLHCPADFGFEPEAGALVHTDLTGVIDEVRWDTSWNIQGDFAVSPLEEANAWANDRPVNWCFDFPTPASQNPHCPGENSDEDGDHFTEEAGDCDDGDASVHPGAPDGTDGRDDNCDRRVDDGAMDDDGDGFTEEGGDCDDADPAINPGAVDDTGDRNCDGVVTQDTGDSAEDSAVDSGSDSGPALDSEATTPTKKTEQKSGCGVGAWVFVGLLGGRIFRRRGGVG